MGTRAEAKTKGPGGHGSNRRSPSVDISKGTGPLEAGRSWWCRALSTAKAAVLGPGAWILTSHMGPISHMPPRAPQSNSGVLLEITRAAAHVPCQVRLSAFVAYQLFR